MSDKELIKGAEAIANDMRVGDIRRLKLAKVVGDHLDWFGRARARGLEWTDIIDLLFKAGITRPDGRPLSRGHLSSLVWRKLQSAGAVSPGPAAVPDRPANRPEASRKRSAAASTDKPKEAADKPIVMASPAAASRPAKRSKTRQADADGRAPDRDKLIAFMRRSAQVRRDD